VSSRATIRLCDAGDGPADVERTRALNDGLFVGRLLGVDIDAAIAVLDSLGGGRRLSTSERRTLAAAYAEAHRRLGAAIDAGGRAVPDGAPALLASDLIAADDRGVLYLKGAGVYLIDLAEVLAALGNLFRTAEARSLAVKIHYV
jgi:hypothetical protein